MGEGPEGRTKGGARGVVIALLAVALVGLGGAALYFSNRVDFKGPAPAVAGPDALARYAVGSMSKLDAPDAPSRLSDLSFNDSEGRPVDTSRFRDRIVVVNLWATWCAPCVTEMPTLAALQQAYPADKLLVIPVSVDPARLLPNAKNFIGVHQPLPLYHDPRFALPTTLGVKGMPATVIYDRQGREIGRLMGEADWASPEARALFDDLVARD